jgi:ABC-type tungstate transport system substrate-binding protein
MGRVAATFSAIALAYPLFAVVMRAELGTAGALALGGVTIAATVLLGVPVFILLCRRGWLHWWQFACGGAAIGTVCLLPFAVGGAALVGALFPMFLVLGAAHGALFWALAVWRNAALDERCPRRAICSPR